MLAVSVEAVIGTIHRAGINCVLMGVHGINGYRDQARATDDVDVLVTKREVQKAIRVLERAFPYLEVRENSAVARFVNPATQKVVIDVMKPHAEKIRLVFRHTVAVGKTHRIPDLEMAIVCKFMAMRGLNRKLVKRLQDAADLMNMVVHNRQTLDLEKLYRLAQKAESNGRAKMQAIIERIDAGQMIEVE